MKLCYAFLLKDSIIREDIWSEYLEQDTDFEILAHCYNDYIGEIPLTVVERVPTSWEQTVPAHFQLFEAFLKTDCTHFILLSESCIPLKSAEYIKKYISDADGTLLTYLSKHTLKKYKKFWNHGNSFRNFDDIDTVAHEQWVIYSRAEVELLSSHKSLILNSLSKSGGDNEMIATFLKKFNPNFKIFEGRHWYIDWTNCTRHPNILSEIEPNESIFARKVNKNTKILKQPISRTIGVFTHIFHTHTFKSIMAQLVNISRFAAQNKYTINWHFSITEGVEYPTIMLSQMQNLGTVNIYPNAGYDIAPFFQEIKKYPTNEYVFKIHSKNNDSWRRKLLVPLVQDVNKIKQNITRLSDFDTWGLCSRMNLTNNICTDTSHFSELCKFYEIDDTPAKYCSGTFYLFKRDYIELLNSLYIEFCKFEHGYIDTCNSYTHAWEFMFGKMIEANGKKLLGC